MENQLDVGSLLKKSIQVLLCLLLCVASGYVQGISARYLAASTDAFIGGEVGKAMGALALFGIFLLAGFGIFKLGKKIERLEMAEPGKFFRLETDGIKSLVTIGVSLWLFGTVSPVASAAAMVVLLASSVMDLFIFHFVEQTEERQKESLGKRKQALEHIMGDMITIKTLPARSYAAEGYKRREEEYAGLKKRKREELALRGLWNSFAGKLCLVGTVGYLAVLCLDGRATVGAMVMSAFLIWQLEKQFLIISGKLGRFGWDRKNGCRWNR